MIASYIALAGVTVFLVRFVRRQRNTAAAADKKQPEPGRTWAGVYSLLAGALLANAIPHFVHGVSGEYFPAPFFHNLGRGAATDAINVVWGAFCGGAGYWLAREHRARLHATTFHVLLGCGFLAMSLFLSVVFSRVTFR